MSDKPASDVPLPYADRPIATAPGHWVLARAGKRVLRPGGAALTADMLAHAGLPGADVVEMAPGLGRTAAEITLAAGDARERAFLLPLQLGQHPLHRAARGELDDGEGPPTDTPAPPCTS